MSVERREVCLKEFQCHISLSFRLADGFHHSSMWFSMRVDGLTFLRYNYNSSVSQFLDCCNLWFISKFQKKKKKIWSDPFSLCFCGGDGFLEIKDLLIPLLLMSPHYVFRRSSHPNLWDRYNGQTILEVIKLRLEGDQVISSGAQLASLGFKHWFIETFPAWILAPHLQRWQQTNSSRFGCLSKSIYKCHGVWRVLALFSLGLESLGNTFPSLVSPGNWCYKKQYQKTISYSTL